MVAINNSQWGTNNSKNLIIMDVILENFKKYGTQKQYRYLFKNQNKINEELLSLSNFFTHLNRIISSNKSKKKQIKQLSGFLDDSGKRFINTENATFIINSISIHDFSEKHGGSIPYQDAYNSYIYNQFENFKNKQVDKNIEKDLEKTISPLNILPGTFKKFVKNEFNIPLNLNDVILIGFSVMPTIGWVFDIFMIFRALLEKRYLYAILVTINCYQYFMYKILSFGLIGINLGPLIKLFYLAPYATSNFTWENVSSRFGSLLENINLSMKKPLII